MTGRSAGVASGPRRRGPGDTLARAVRDTWSAEAPTARARALSALLAPASGLWWGATRLRNAWYDRAGGRTVPDIAVISVGNLVVGGTGKTPLVSWAVARLRDAGLRPAVVLRGYGRDEILLHRRWHPDVPVHADPDRVAAVAAARGGGADVAVVDDGFQHRRLARDLDVVLLAAEDPVPGRCLPSGPYREPVRGLARAGAVVVTRRTASAERAGEVARAAAVWTDAPVARVLIRPGRWLDLGGRGAPPPDGPILVAAAVARPEAVRAAVAAALPGARDVEILPFPDHHEYAPSDVALLRARGAGRTVVVTEKDAVKLEGLEGLPADVRVLAAELAWEEGEPALEARILAAARGSGA